MKGKGLATLANELLFELVNELCLHRFHSSLVTQHLVVSLLRYTTAYNKQTATAGNNPQVEFTLTQQP